MKDYLAENIRFVMKTELLIGDGIARELPVHLKSRSWRRIGLVIDKGLYDGNAYSKEIVKLLESELERVVLLVNEMAEPTYDYLDEVKARFDEYNLDVDIRYRGRLVEIPTERPHKEELRTDPEAAARLAGFLIGQFADKIKAEQDGEMCHVRLHFDH